MEKKNSVEDRGIEMKEKGALGALLTTTDVNANSNVFTALNDRMVKIFFYGFWCAWLYIIFPVVNKDGNANYWAYYLAKEFYWSLFGNSAFVEMFEAALPGSPATVYTYSYLCGLFIPPFLHIIAYPLDAYDNAALNILAVTSSLIVTTSLYGYWQISAYFERREARKDEDYLTRQSSIVVTAGVTYDMFSQVMDSSDRETMIFNEGSSAAGNDVRASSLVGNDDKLISSFRKVLVVNCYVYDILYAVYILVETCCNTPHPH